MQKTEIKPENAELLLGALREIAASPINDDRGLSKILKKYSKPEGGIFAKENLVSAYYHFLQIKQLEPSSQLLSKIRMKPTRSISGVLPVTVLTRPYPCPGRCIFCPNDVRMPKSYLSDEPGAQRAERNNFDPYLQTYNRLQAYQNTGHELSKVELIILGGTWSYYPEAYQLWFIKRCFDALNDFGKDTDERGQIKTINIFTRPEKVKAEFTDTGRRRSYNERITELERNFSTIESKPISTADKVRSTHLAKFNQEFSSWDDLRAAHKINETAICRCVGLVIETRPDHINEKEVIRVRSLGATKTQIGFQSLQDKVLDLNHRGHDVAATANSVKLVRSAGFKIHAHWMPNLYGSTPEQDKQDYLKLWTAEFQPDELKIYPCSLIETAELMDYYNKGLWKPYTEAELLDVLTFCLLNTPRHVRLTRIIRDIPSTDIVVGNKKTNFREIAEAHAQESISKVVEIRSREIKSRQIDPAALNLEISTYPSRTITGNSQEFFLEFVNDSDKICGFLRLCLPKKGTHFIKELEDSALIREIHVYGVVRKLSESSANDSIDQEQDSSQHLGLGKKLLVKAQALAKEQGYKTLSVISAIGTKEYYRKNGFRDGELYQHLSL